MGLLDSAGVSYLLGLIKGTFLAKEDTATVAISGKFTDLTNLPTTLLGYGIKDAYTIDQIKALITALFTYGGSCTFANLPTPSASNVNHVYNVTEPFTTTSSFMEGAGGWYPAGTDVVVVAVTNNGTTTYVYDSFTGLIDLSPYLKITDLKSSVITAFGYTPYSSSGGVITGNVLIGGNSNLTFFADTPNHVTGTISGTQYSGNSSTATKWAKSIKIAGASVDGSGDVDVDYSNIKNTPAIFSIPVGHIQQQYTVESGYLALDGSTYSRATYAALWAWAQSITGLVSATPSAYQFGTGDGSTTFTVPNHTGRVWQGAAAIGQKEAGVPNITGGIGQLVGKTSATDSGTSALYWGGHNGGVGESSYQSSNIPYDPQFDASRCNSIYGASTTVQPPAILLIPQIKY